MCPLAAPCFLFGLIFFLSFVFFLMWTSFDFLAAKRVGSWLPEWGSNPQSLHGKVKSSPLGRLGSPRCHPCFPASTLCCPPPQAFLRCLLPGKPQPCFGMFTPLPVRWRPEVTLLGRVLMLPRWIRYPPPHVSGGSELRSPHSRPGLGKSEMFWKLS